MLYDGLSAQGLPDSEVLAKLQAALDKQTETTITTPKPAVVLSMKSPKAAERQGAGGVFFNAAGEDDFATQGEDDEDNDAMVADLKFMAEGGDADSAFDLGVIYRTGSYGVKKDHDEVVKWWKKAADLPLNLLHLPLHGLDSFPPPSPPPTSPRPPPRTRGRTDT